MRIILVEPQHPGNVGAVARAMANFGVEELAIVTQPLLEKIHFEKDSCSQFTELVKATVLR